MRKIFLFLIIFTIIITSIITSCSKTPSEIQKEQPTVSTNTDIQKNDEFIDKFIFLGESTTYHLKHRGVLAEGTNTKQVWAPKSGTLMLDTTTCECRIIFPETGEEIELSDALKKKQPEYLMLTFGLNGASNFINRGKEYFKLCYQKLINTVKNASPKTIIYINSCFPIAKNMDMSKYKINSKTLNSYIDTINVWAKEFAIQNSLIYINTATTLKDKDGYLSDKYQVEDGYHLNTLAYKKILNYIKTNPKGESNES